MAVYRIYLVHPGGRLESDEAFHSATDREAVVRFRASTRADTAVGRRAELWQGGRQVALAMRVRPQAAPSART